MKNEHVPIRRKYISLKLKLICRYKIEFTENCGILENEVEIYEYMQPSNSITRMSVLYGTVPSPLAHLLIDYRNMRQAQIRQSYADAYNTHAKFICSYNSSQVCHLSFFVYINV